MEQQAMMNKPHYNILDGLRGVAALLVVWYHIFEGFAFAEATNGAGDGLIKTFNHGYLAVDFFFMLSGFVISYAYDSRWQGMSVGKFFKRRLVRLHPMVIIGAIIGTLAFCVGGCSNWSGESASWYNIVVAAILGMLLLPAIPGCSNDVRGNGEMFPLNGPSWSLFFEYLGNIIYALIIRRLSTKWLKVTAIVLGLLFGYFAITDMSGYGSIGVGWTLDKINFTGGLLRMLFPFTVGMAIRRSLFAYNGTKEANSSFSLKAKGISKSWAFMASTIILILMFSVPFLGVEESFSMNGLYEFCTIALVFPLIIIMGAGAGNELHSTNGKRIDTISNFLGRLSYPLYIIHYPIMYLLYSWMIKEEVYTLSQGWPAVAAAITVILIVAVLSMKLYEFVEKILKRRL